MDQIYKYTSLSSKNRQIRLVTLRPGTWSDEIRCNIEIVPFDGHPPYEALSYVWGADQGQKGIWLDNCLFDVTKNLWLALRRLRDLYVSRVLWIDAICINQGDSSEKSHQVAFMGEIYSSCRNAIVWLGGDLDTTEAGSRSIIASRACEMLELLGTDKHLNELPCFSAGDYQRTEIAEEYVAHFNALQQFVDIQWWKRIWVIQEMVLPRNLQFFYASEEFAYETLRIVVQGLQKHGTTCCKQYRYTLRASAFDPILTLQERIEPMVFTRETWTHQTPMTLSRLRRHFSASQATNKCDLFYALLGLVTSWGSHEPLYPDYTIPRKDAITQAVFKCISEEEGLGFLLGERIFRTEEAMPSWIPNAHFMEIQSQWVIIEQRRLRIYSNFSASGSLRQEASQLTMMNGALCCQTLKVGDVVDVGPICEALEHFEEAPDIFRQWMQMVGIGMNWPEKPPTAGSLEDVFWKTMLNDSIELDTSESPFYRRTNEADYAQIRSLWMLLLSPLGGILTSSLSLSEQSHDDLMSKAPAIVYHLLVCLWHRRLFRTDQGWIGLAPENCRVGDEVHVLLGSPAPFILRKLVDPCEIRPTVCAYTIIGNAYVHEIMLGEGFKNKEKDIETVVLC
jgi:hypothetical protein